VIAALVGAGAIIHFLPGRPILTVDGFFHLNNSVNCSQDLRSWTVLTSTGKPNTSLGLLPGDCSLAVLQSTHLPLWITEALFEALLGAIAALGMYSATKSLMQVLNVEAGFAPAIAAVFWVSNPFSLSSVWYHALYLQVLWAALPWLCARVLTADGNQKLGRVCLGMMAITVIGAPGLTEGELPQTFLVLLFLSTFMFAVRGRRAFLRSIVVIGACGAGLLWWLLPSLSNLGGLYTAAVKGLNTSAVLRFASTYSTIWHLLTLVAVPQLYQTVDGTPYIAWSAIATSGWGRVVVAGIPVLGALGVLSLTRSARLRAIAPILGMLALGLGLCKGLAEPFPVTGAWLSRLPFGAIFRQPLNNFGLLIVVPITIFVGLGGDRAVRFVVECVRRGHWYVLDGAAAVGVLGAVAVVVAPWWSAWVFPVGGGIFPSASYSMPSDYAQVGRLLGQAPIGGKTLVLPFSRDGESAFVWPSGVQPNTDPLFEAWQPRRTVLENSGGNAENPGLQVARCISAGRPRCVQLAAYFGFDRIIIHKDWSLAYLGTRIAVPTPEVAMEYFFGSPESSTPVIRSGELLPVHPAGILSFWVNVASLPSTQARFISFDGFYVQLNRQNFFSIYSPSRRIWDPGPVLGRTATPSYLTLTWTQHELRLWVDGIQQGKAIAFPGPPPRAVMALPPGSAPGTSVATSGVIALSRPTTSCGVGPCGVRAGAGLLFNGKYLSLLSIARASPLLGSMACIPSTSHPIAQLPALLYGGTFRVVRSGCTRVEFRETFARGWSLTADTRGAEVLRHVVAAGDYNKWVVEGASGAMYTLRYSVPMGVPLMLSLGVLGGLGYVLAVFVLGASLRSVFGATPAEHGGCRPRHSQ
jgi:hypothetical protein